MEAYLLQSLNDALARKGFPPVASYQTSSSVPIDALHVDNVPRFKVASYMTGGLDRLSSRTADSLISRAIPIGDCAQVLEAVINNRALGKAEIRSKSYRRRWSVDCSSYPEGKESLSNENDEYKPALKYASVFNDTDAVKEAEAFAQDTHMYIQRLDVFNRNYTPSGNPSHTVLETANASINEAGFLNFLTLGPNDGWFHDSHIDISLDILERAADCQKHGISICRVGQDTELYTAAERKQRFPNEPDTHFDNLLVKKCRDKDFILIPISNGFKDAHKIGLELELRREAVKINFIPEPKRLSQTVGQHWSLLLVDCRYPIIRGRYFDSSCHESAGSSRRAAVEELNNSKAAQVVLYAVIMMLNGVQPGRFDENKVVFNLDPRCPNQGYENVSGSEDGMGA